MSISDDFVVDPTGKTIRHVGTTGQKFTVVQLHRHLQEALAPDLRAFLLDLLCPQLEAAAAAEVRLGGMSLRMRTRYDGKSRRVVDVVGPGWSRTLLDQPGPEPHDPHRNDLELAARRLGWTTEVG